MTKGFTAHVCECGEEYVDSYVDELGHAFAYQSNGDATCEQDGTESATCSREGCGATDTRTEQNSKLGHLFEDYQSDDNATCEQDGTETPTCSHAGCDETDTRTEQNSKLGHDFKNYQSDGNATCLVDGTETATCSHAGCDETDTRTEQNSKLGHDFKNYQSNGNATCEKDGTETATCSREDCNETHTRTEQNSTTGHSYQEEVTEETYLKSSATCSNKAVYYKSCACGAKSDSETDVFEYGEIAEHPKATEWSSDKTHHWHETTCDHDVQADYAEHTADDSGYCSACDLPVQATKGIVYEKSTDEKYAIVKKYTGTSTRVIIAADYEGLPVTTIDERAFYYSDSYCKTKITSVVLPDCLTTIKYKAFGSQDLTEIVIPDSVTTIKDTVFNNCSKLKSVTLGKGVTSIGNGAFYHCFSLTNLVLPDSVTKIGRGAFEVCNSLQFTTVDNLKYLGTKTNPHYALIEETDTQSTYTVHEDTKIIADEAFYNNRLAEIISLPSGLIAIGRSAFFECSKLTSLTIPQSVTTIEQYAFYNCSSLTSLTIPQNVTTIGASAFIGCSGLTSLTISEGVTTIGDFAFGSCSGLTSVIIPESVTAISESAFKYCEKLTIYCKATSQPTGWEQYWNGRPVYWFSKTQPATTGKYWHYNDSNEIEIWS